MERELGISLSGGSGEANEKEETKEQEEDARNLAAAFQDVPQQFENVVEEPKNTSEEDAKEKVKEAALEEEPIADIVLNAEEEETPEEIVTLVDQHEETIDPLVKEREDEMARWERELGISLSADPSPVPELILDPGNGSHISNGGEMKEEDQDLADLERDLDFSIDLDLDLSEDEL